MAEIKSGVTLTLKDLFSQNMNKAAGAASGFAGKTLGAVEKVDKAVSGTAAKLGALGLTLSVGAAAKGVIELDHRMTRLGISAGANADKIGKLKRAVFDAARAADVKIDPANILSGIEAIVSQTSDLKFAEDNIRNVALAVQATGESGESMGALFSEFRKFEYTAEQITSIMDDMAAQANQGAFSLGEFAKAAPQIFTAMDAKKMGAAPENIKSVNAALQIINAGAKNPAKAVLAFNSALSEITDPKNAIEFRKLGVKVKDASGNFRDFNDIMLDLAERAEDRRYADFMEKTFGDSAMQAVRSFMSHGKRMRQSLADLGDTSGLLQRQSAEMAGTLQSNIKNLQTAFNSFADSSLTKPLEHLTGLLNKLAEDPERVEKVFKGIAKGIGAITLVKGMAGVSRFVGNLLQLQKNGGKIDIGGALNAATAMPVYVTNWGGGPGVPGAGGPGPGSGAPRQPPPLEKKTTAQNARNAVKTATPGALRAGAATSVITAAVELPEMISEVKAINQNEELTKKEKGKAKGGAIGSWSGKSLGAGAGVAAGTLLGALAAGALTGTAIGTAVPGLGNIIGLIAGAGIGAAGYYFGGKAGRKTGEAIGGAVAGRDERNEEILRKQPNRSGRRPTRKTLSYMAREREMRAADLPPQITQPAPSLAPQTVEFGGRAVMDVNVNLSGASPTASVTMRENDTMVRFETGSRDALRRSGL